MLRDRKVAMATLLLLLSLFFVASIYAAPKDSAEVPSVPSRVETPPVVNLDEPPSGTRFGDGDDPAIWIHPTNPARSLLIVALKEGGLDVYDLDGGTLQSINTGGSERYNNVDVLYGFTLGEAEVDLAVASDRKNDRLAIFTIDPSTRQLEDVTDYSSPLIFTPAGLPSNGSTTAYGLAGYHSSFSGEHFVFVSQRRTSNVAQLALLDRGETIGWEQVRAITLPTLDGVSPQIEGMVADQELGVLYLGQEKVGIWKTSAEPESGNAAVLIEPAGEHLVPDVEGLTLYYARKDQGYLLASSQGDSTFTVFDRAGDNEYLGSFRVGEAEGIDGVEQSDGADVVNVPLGHDFPKGLLVVHDGSNNPPVHDEDGQNVNTNFKYVGWEDVAKSFKKKLKIDRYSYNPRD